MAPECFDPVISGGLTEKVDIFSFGTLLWEMVTLKKAWDGQNGLMIAVGHSAAQTACLQVTHAMIIACAHRATYMKACVHHAFMHLHA